MQTPVSLDYHPILTTSFSLNYLLKAPSPNMVKLGLRVSKDLWVFFWKGDTIQSITAGRHTVEGKPER